MSAKPLAEVYAKLLSEKKLRAEESAIDETEWLFSTLGEFTGEELRELLYMAQEPGFFELMRAIFSIDESRRKEILADVFEKLKDLRRRGEFSQLDSSTAVPETVEKLGSLTRFLEIRTLANRVFGDEKATAWLNRTNSSFSDQKPIDLLKDELGAAVVREALEQIDHGIFA